VASKFITPANEPGVKFPSEFMESRTVLVPFPEPAGGFVTLKIACVEPAASVTLPHAALATLVTPPLETVPLQTVAVPPLMAARTEVLGIEEGPDNAAVELESQA